MMPKWFVNNKRNNELLNIEWKLMRGGYLYIGRVSWVFLHRWMRRGLSYFGNEKEFITRLELVIEREPRFSWFTLELINPFEARIFFIWLKLWKGYSLRFILNVGWRLTRASRDFLANELTKFQRSGKLNLERKGGNRKNATIIR